MVSYSLMDIFQQSFPIILHFFVILNGAQRQNCAHTNRHKLDTKTVKDTYTPGLSTNSNQIAYNIRELRNLKPKVEVNNYKYDHIILSVS